MERTSPRRGINLSRSPGNAAQDWQRVLVEISQIGKVCHTRCAIYYLAGDCIFPTRAFWRGTTRAEKPYRRRHQVVKLGDGTCSFTPAEASRD
ncbi:MAG: hypothetical protein ACLTYW_08455 [Collinsella sp.]